MKRIISVWLNNFPLNCLKWQTRRQAHPPYGSPPADREPFALVHKDTHGVRISAPNEEARQNGVHSGMRLTDARAILPTLITRPAQPRAYAAILQRLADWCRRYTPTVGIDGANGLWLDITGAAHLMGGEGNLLGDLSERLRAIGFASRSGLADTPGAAWAIARFSSVCPPGHFVRIAPGETALALRPLPLTALRIEDGPLHLLARFGLQTIGQLYALPRASLKRRFASREAGEAVLHRLDQALGRTPEPLTPLRPPPAYGEHLRCLEPILETKSFHIGLEELLSRLIKSMERDGKGATRLTFFAYHADGGLSRASIALARPCRDHGHISHVFRERIEKLNPGFGVDHLALCADRVERLADMQLALVGGPVDPGSDKSLQLLIDRLANRLGPHTIQRAVQRESHIPEQAEIRISALRSDASDPTQSDRRSIWSSRSHSLIDPRFTPVGSCSKPLRPFRLLEPPESIRVLAEIPEGPPKQFTWRRLTHRVTLAEGPERIAPQWWSALQKPDQKQARTRDYYRVEDEKGRRFWLFREGLYRDIREPHLPGWYMHGLFS